MAILRRIGSETEALGGAGFIQVSQRLRQYVAPLLVAIGMVLIWLGPSLSGLGALRSAWCSSGETTWMTQLSGLAWLATQHCPYCYLGVALIVAGGASLTFDLRAQLMK